MTTRNLIILGGVAAVLVAAGYLAGGKGSSRSPRLNGQRLLPSFDMEAVASLEVGDAVRLSAGETGWTIATYQDYPADRRRIAENLLKLQDLKVGQVIRGKTIGEEEKVPVTVRDPSGRELASLTLGARHEKWGFGRYAQFKGETVLVGDTLDAFGSDPKAWCETKIVDDPWISFKDLADPTLADSELGFATGVVAKVTIAGDTNRVATVGATVKGGTDRYLRIDGLKWTFVVPSYSVEKLLPKPEPQEESAEEPAAEAPVVEAEAPVAAEEVPVAEEPKAE